MSHLFGTELYKWKRSKGFYGCLLAAAGIIVVEWLSLLFTDQVNRAQGFSFFDEYTLMDMVKTFVGGGASTFFVAIFVCIWIIGEYTDGAIKNVIGKGYPRSSIFLIKYGSAVLISTALNLVLIAATVLVGIAVMGAGRTGGAFWQDCLAYTGVELMLGAAFGGVIVAVSELVRNMALGISASIFFFVFSRLAANGMDICLRLLDIDFMISDYWITCVIENCPAEGIGLDFAGRAVFVAVMWTAVSLTVGMAHFCRADI